MHLIRQCVEIHYVVVHQMQNVMRSEIEHLTGHKMTQNKKHQNINSFKLYVV